MMTSTEATAVASCGNNVKGGSNGCSEVRQAMMENMVLALDAPSFPNQEASTSSIPKAAFCGETTGLKTYADEPDLPNVFDVVEEYVGMNDEYMYGFSYAEPQQPDAQPEQPDDESSSATANTAQPPTDVEFNDIDPQEVEKGAQFPDIITFRKAIRHYAIIKGFEFANLKADTTRSTTKCAQEGCPWRIHASRLQDDRTIEIKTLPFEHNCSTTKLCVGKMAT